MPICTKLFCIYFYFWTLRLVCILRTKHLLIFTVNRTIIFNSIVKIRCKIIYFNHQKIFSCFKRVFLSEWFFIFFATLLKHRYHDVRFVFYNSLCRTWLLNRYRLRYLAVEKFETYRKIPKFKRLKFRINIFCKEYLLFCRAVFIKKKKTKQIAIIPKNK